MKRTVLVALLIFSAALAALTIDVRAASIVLKNDKVQRELAFDGQVWRTIRFVRGDGSDAIEVKSDEFDILLMNDGEVTIGDYVAITAPARDESEQAVTISYRLREGAKHASGTPKDVTLRYSLSADGCLRKTVTVHPLNEGDAIDRLEVERFSCGGKEERGGRGEPVFINAKWLFGVEYPAFYSRHTDGNTPAAGAGPYEKFGNYSFIDLEGRDVDKHPRDGLVRLMQFPGEAKKMADGTWGIVSKTAVEGVAKPGDSAELGFLDYLNTIRRPVRSFLHYNNWYDTEGKKLTVENFAGKTYGEFEKHLKPFGVRIDAMVADDGWQNRKSIYEPNPAQFPNGIRDMAALSQALERDGTSLGLWIALNGYNSDIDWGKANGYIEADRNERFSRFKRYYALSNPKYNAAIGNRLMDLIQQCHVTYIKHDFNEMCDKGDASGHLATDRHGHEAEVDAQIGLLELERKLNPDIYQNITNWIWFSPWWLAQGNNLWMLSSDSGEFNGWPEMSGLIRAAAYRDVNLYQVWHDPATRPLVPISHLMTHGIIYTKSKYSGADDTLREFADHVMMYYMRGVQLKEWYINPSILSAEQWEVLGRATRWSQEHAATLANAVYVGGDPARGQAYGYACWKGEEGILSARNPSLKEAEMTVPFDQSVWYRGEVGKEFSTRMIYPYQGDWGGSFRSGQPMRLTVPGNCVMVMQISPGKRGKPADLPSPPVATAKVEDQTARCTVAIPDEAMQRCDLVVIRRGSEGKVEVQDVQTLPRAASGKGWTMQVMDVRPRQGKHLYFTIANSDQAEAWLVMDRAVVEPQPDGDARLPMPVAQGLRRQTVKLWGK